MGSGIDYGHGHTNIDKETGIRYGVIPHHAVMEFWCEESEANYPPLACPDCGYEFDDKDRLDNDPEIFVCSDCAHEYFEYKLNDCTEPIGHIYKKEDYEITQSFEDCDLFVLKAPYYTLAEYCSPCAPGACYLLSPDPQGDKAYCLTLEHFDSEHEVPYPVYRVTDGICVHSEELFDQFVDAYIECALWSSIDSHDDSGEPLDTNYSSDDLSDDCYTNMRHDCYDFWIVWYERLSTHPSQGGHDFWLNRNGHGAGFWDRQDIWSDDYMKLSDAAKIYNEVNLYVSDDGKIEYM